MPSTFSLSPPQYKTITLDRGPDGLGFSIVGGYGSPHGDLPIYVKTVFGKVRGVYLCHCLSLQNRQPLLLIVCTRVCVFRAQLQRTGAWSEETRSWPSTGRLWRGFPTKRPSAFWRGPKEPSRSPCCHRPPPPPHALYPLLILCSQQHSLHLRAPFLQTRSSSEALVCESTRTLKHKQCDHEEAYATVMFEGLLQARVVLKALLSRNGNLNEAVNSIRNIPPLWIWSIHWTLWIVFSAVSVNPVKITLSP